MSKDNARKGNGADLSSGTDKGPLWASLDASSTLRMDLGDEDDERIIKSIRCAMSELQAVLVEKTLVPDFSAHVYRVGEQFLVLTSVYLCGIEVSGSDPLFSEFVSRFNRIKGNS